MSEPADTRGQLRWCQEHRIYWRRIESGAQPQLVCPAFKPGEVRVVTTAETRAGQPPDRRPR